MGFHRSYEAITYERYTICSLNHNHAGSIVVTISD